MVQKIQAQYFLSLFLLLTPLHSFADQANTVVATVAVGVTPAGMAVTPDSKFLYVADNNNYGLTGSDGVTVINTATNLPVTFIADPSFNEPYTISINPAGTKAYVTNSNSTTVTIIDIATNTVIGTITGFDGPSGMAITPDGNTGYVNNYGGPGGVGSGNGTTVRVVNLNTNTIVGSAITVGQAPAALAITPDGKFVYVINYVDGNPGNGTISVIRTSDNTVVDTINGLSGPFAIAITPDGNFAYITNFGSNNFYPYGATASVVDLNTNTIIATIPLGIQPSGIGITPDGKYAYATNYNTLYAGSGFTNLTPGQGTVNIIDIATNTVISPTIAVDQSPANVAIAPNGQYAYVSNYTSNTVNVIALPSFNIVGQGCKILNVSLTQVDLINRLTWSVGGTSLPVSYSIYRDAGLTDLVAIVPATGPLQFLDRNRAPNVVYTYYLLGTNATGTTSNPITITVTQNC